MMTYRLVDTLNADQIEPGDLIGLGGKAEPVFVKSIDILADGYLLNYLDEYDDVMLSEFVLDDTTVDLYVFDEDE